MGLTLLLQLVACIASDCRVLDGLKLGDRYCKVFLENDWDEGNLCDMKKEDFGDLGMKAGALSKIRKYCDGGEVLPEQRPAFCSMMSLVGLAPNWCGPPAPQGNPKATLDTVKNLQSIAEAEPPEFTVATQVHYLQDKFENTMVKLRAEMHSPVALVREIVTKHEQTIKQLARNYRDLEFDTQDVMSQHSALSKRMGQAVVFLASALATGPERRGEAKTHIELIIQKIDDMIGNVMGLRNTLTGIQDAVRDEERDLEYDTNKLKEDAEVDSSAAAVLAIGAVGAVIAAPSTGGASLAVAAALGTGAAGATLGSSEKVAAATNLAELHEGLSMVLSRLEERAKQYKGLIHQLDDTKVGAKEVASLSSFEVEDINWNHVESVALSARDAFRKLSSRYDDFLNVRPTTPEALASGDSHNEYEI